MLILYLMSSVYDIFYEQQTGILTRKEWGLGTFTK
jgi:hypothetical protein